MKNNHRVTYALAVLVLLTLIAFSVAKTCSGSISVANDQKQTAMQKHQDAKKTFPLVDYDEPESSDPVKRADAREKQKRRNTLSEVMTTPHPQDAEINLIADGGVELSGLPVDKSDLIVEGNVLSAEAHMSGNKKNVVSEFMIHVEKVYKAVAPPAPAAGSSITVERFGGNIRYPNGQTVLYRWAGTSMPKVGRRYIFFLESITQSHDYTILTGYELGEKDVSPLDASPQFEALRGMGISELVKRLNTSLTQP